MTVEYKRFIRDAKAQLVNAYKYSRDHDNTPESTATSLIDAIGVDSASEIVAVMVLSKGDWDARISRESRAWAAGVCEYTADELRTSGVYYCDEIHPTHMEQTAAVLRKLSPKKKELLRMIQEHPETVPVLYAKARRLHQ